ncbi:hypothetical protein QR680_002143 [Steinernema hermaphroditum]|uniref:Uncharacterized protein n=1 Tax=Steinernema hermaphroditum TaxID=289476 RepID=A0AA39LHI6_9BILA|nr:hypothetical protein QR680_002143 [Steinernema hermaphroditum]
MLLLAHDGTCTAVELTTFFGSEEGNDFFAPALFIALLFLLITQWTAASYFFIGFTFEPIPKGCTSEPFEVRNLRILRQSTFADYAKNQRQLVFWLSVAIRSVNLVYAEERNVPFAAAEFRPSNTYAL